MKSKRWVVPVVFFLLVAVLAVAFLVFPKPKAVRDRDAAMGHLVRGVGLMEQRKDAEAEAAFLKAIELDPDWTAAQINYGIALFNQQPADTKELAVQVKKAQQVFADVLTKEPDNRHAHYCLGMIDMYIGQYGDAYPHFQKVNQLDPDDAHTWLRLGSTHPDGPDSRAAGACYEKAIALDPYLIEAKYKLFIILRDTDEKRAEAMLTEQQAFQAADQFTESRIVYGEMGKYGEVIGRDVPVPQDSIKTIEFETTRLAVRLGNNRDWANGGEDVESIKLKTKFGHAMIVFDYNSDGRPDVFFVGAVFEKAQKKYRDLLLRNDGDLNLSDVTLDANLIGEHSGLGAAAGDFDNDGKPDLVITTTNGIRLFHNTGGRFEDVTEKAGLHLAVGRYLGCLWVDIDLDGDLDLIVCRHGANGGVDVYENVGVAGPAPANGPPPALSIAFKKSEAFKSVFPVGPAVSVLATDIDDDKDLDLVALYDDKPPIVAFNDRLMRWRQGSISGWEGTTAEWLGGVTGDVNRDGRSDLLLMRKGDPVFLRSQGARSFERVRLGATADATQAIMTDADLDGVPEIVMLRDGAATVDRLREDGSISKDVTLGSPNLQAIAAADLTGDGRPDLLTFTGTQLELLVNKSPNQALIVQPTGRRDRGSNMRTSNDGVGTWLVAQTGHHWAGAERTTTTAGLGQSLGPTILGMGKHDKATTLRVRWPDNVIQAEMDIPTGKPYVLVETNRKGTSCPILMTWNGEKFAFVTDFLGAGALGECGPDGSVRPPRGEESVKIEAGLLKPRNGEYVLKIAEPMDEVLYLDHVKLAVIDHPPTTAVYPDERFVFSGPQPTQKLLAFETQHHPVHAGDHRGQDMSERVRVRDRKAVDTFHVRSWLGYAEEHVLNLEFGSLPKSSSWNLVLAGWTEYPYPESMYAATTAGVALLPPVLERFDTDRKQWDKVCDLGFPAGLPRVMTCALPSDPTGKLRIRTNMQVYWDEIYAAPALDTPAFILDVKHAELKHRGFMKEILPDGQPPVAYDDSRTDPLIATRWKGKLTKLGDVTDLLTKFDDRFVLCGPGDEITVRFDASLLPALKPGWTRSFVLHSQGYCKDTSTTTLTGGTVGPLPFRGMPNYPQFGDAKPPATDAGVWQTRWADRLGTRPSKP